MKKINKSKVLLIGIFIYILFHIILMFVSKNIKTLVLEPNEMNIKINTKGIFIKEEHIITSNTKGSIERLGNEGEKIKKDEPIAYIYKNKKNDKIISQIEDLNEEIKELNIQLQNEVNKMNKNIIKNQLKTKKELKSILEKEKEDNMISLKSPISGVVSYSFDGNEEKYNLDSLDEITKDDIENTSNNYESIIENKDEIKNGDNVVKVIDSNQIYLAICISEEESEKLQINQNVDISLNDEIIGGKVYKIYPDEADNIVILKITTPNIAIYDTRIEEFDIIYKKIEGLKIPKDSIKEIDNKRGVYVINEQTRDIEFTELKGIEYEDEDFIFINYYKNNIEGEKTVKLHDEIILKPNTINKNIKMK